MKNYKKLCWLLLALLIISNVVIIELRSDFNEQRLRDIDAATTFYACTGAMPSPVDTSRSEWDSMLDECHDKSGFTKNMYAEFLEYTLSRDK